LLNEDDYENALDEFGDESFEVSIGAEAIKKILSDMNLE
jgi:DNA-directed RNA polymerase subunit beta'